MPYRIKVAIVYLLGFFVDLINMFIANVAYPSIGHALQASVGELAWVSNGYILGLTLVIPLSAWLAQRIGGRRVFLLSLTLFMLATAAAGYADSIGELVGWRVLQGMGGGLLIPIGQTLTYQLYRSHERAGLSAAIMLVGLLAPALSPALGADRRPARLALGVLCQPAARRAGAAVGRTLATPSGTRSATATARDQGVAQRLYGADADLTGPHPTGGKRGPCARRVTAGRRSDRLDLFPAP